MSIGVYGIFCKANGRWYIGSSVRIKIRWRQHRNALVKNCHHSSKLQNAWNKYGEDVFQFSVLQTVKMSECLKTCEQAWIDKLNSYDDGFNSASSSFSPAGHKHSEEAKKRMGDSRRGKLRGKYAVDKTKTHPRKGKTWTEEQIASCNRGPMSDDHKAKISAAAKLHIFTDEHRAKISSALRGKPRKSSGPPSPEHRAKISVKLTASWARKRAEKAGQI